MNLSGDFHRILEFSDLSIVLHYRFNRIVNRSLSTISFMSVFQCIYVRLCLFVVLKELLFQVFVHLLLYDIGSRYEMYFGLLFLGSICVLLNMILI